MSEEVELLPVEYDQHGRPRRYEVVRVGDQQPVQPPQVIEVPELGNYPVRQQRSTSHIEGSYTDRARGFSISTNNLALVTAAFVGAAVLVIGDDVTFAVFSAWTIGGYFAIWLVSFALHTFVSAEGSEFLETVFLWRFLFNEQRERHRMYRPVEPMGIRLFRFVVTTGLFFVIMAGGMLLLAQLGVIE